RGRWPQDFSDRPGAVVALNRSARSGRHPNTALLVDCEPVGVPVLDLNQDLLSHDPSPLELELEYAPAYEVRNVEKPRLAIEADSVWIGNVARKDLEAALRIDSVHLARRPGGRVAPIHAQTADEHRTRGLRHKVVEAEGTVRCEYAARFPIANVDKVAPRDHQASV